MRGREGRGGPEHAGTRLRARGRRGRIRREGRRRSPLSIFDRVIRLRRGDYASLKGQAASLVFLREKRRAEQIERRIVLARAHQRLIGAVRRRDDRDALALIEVRRELRGEVDRADREIVRLRAQCRRAQQELAELGLEIDRLERERDRARRALDGDD